MAAKKKPTGRSADAIAGAAEAKRTVSNNSQLAKAVADVKNRLTYSDVRKYGYDFSSVKNLSNDIGDVHSEGASFEKFSTSIIEKAYKVVAAEYVERANKSNALRKAVGPVAKPAVQKNVIRRGTADTQEKRAVAAEAKRTGKGQGYDKLKTPAEIAAYYASQKAARKKMK